MSYVVVSGVPGSGKSTLARRLSPRIGLSVLDKDDILESLFDSRGVGDAAWRSTLSRVADDELRRAASDIGAVILVSWWRHPHSTTDTGTPTAWLTSLPGKLVEVHCVCPPRIAAARFTARQRHAGHLDETRDAQSIIDDIQRVASLGPLRLGPVLEVLTEGDVDLDAVEEWIRRHT